MHSIVTAYCYRCCTFRGLCICIVCYGPCFEWWGAGIVICLERGADLHMAQLKPLPQCHSVSCFSKTQIGFTFLALAHPGSPGKRAI